MNRYSIPALRPNGVGLTERCRCAYNQPETLASNAASTKISTFIQVVLTPIASAITAPPLSARIARPEREFNKFCKPISATSKIAQIR